MHIDFAGLVSGQMFLTMVDAYSDWLEAILMLSTTNKATIRVLRLLFATNRQPDAIVSDNGAQLTLAAFKSCLGHHGIQHALIVPFHLSSNSQAERIVQSTKEVLSHLSSGTGRPS